MKKKQQNKKNKKRRGKRETGNKEDNEKIRKQQKTAGKGRKATYTRDPCWPSWRDADALRRQRLPLRKPCFARKKGEENQVTQEILILFVLQRLQKMFSRALIRSRKSLVSSSLTLASPRLPVSGSSLADLSILNKVEATQVNLVSTDGEIGVLADHVPTIAQLVPGVLEVFTPSEKPKKFFVSGGFAIMNPDSTLNINAVEAVPIDEIDFDAAKKASDEASRKLASATSEEEKATLKIELGVYEAISYAAANK
ncbi:ATP synthase subunit delta, mitochondrial [Nowakowskiella sp. JEL0078]|nr:ATP synthase subunit delta, mitochondrial [Nowakowskiella sp. JEL0078]